MPTSKARRGSAVMAAARMKAAIHGALADGATRTRDLGGQANTVTFTDALRQDLHVMDATAFALCRDQKLPIKVFSIFKPGALKRVVLGEDEGTLVHV